MLARVMGATKETVSRWEKGHVAADDTGRTHEVATDCVRSSAEMPCRLRRFIAASGTAGWARKLTVDVAEPATTATSSLDKAERKDPGGERAWPRVAIAREKALQDIASQRRDH
jgi:hypothetical protein